MRESRRFVAVIASVLALVAGNAQAQEKRVNVSFGAGYTAPNAEVRNHLGDGYNINFGLQVNLNRKIGIEGLYSFNGLGEKQISVGVSGAPGGPTVPTDFFGDMNMQYGTADVVFQGEVANRTTAYVLAGGGVYYRPITVTTPGVGYVPPFCDPWWYICYPGGFVPVDRIVGSRSSTDFGMNFGGGFTTHYFYTEVRYHYIWGPKVSEQAPVFPGNPSGSLTSDRKANGQFLQVTFGVRF